MALEHARSFEQLALRANHDARLQEFAQELLEATGREEIYADCIRFASVLLGTSHVALLMADPRAVELRLTAGAGWGLFVGLVVALVSGVAAFLSYRSASSRTPAA